MAVLFIIALGIALPGCATKEKEKAWEHPKHKWYDPDLPPDDREFYRQFFFGNN